MRIEVVVRSGEPLTGWVSADGGAARPFAGWMALLAILSDLTSEATRLPGAPRPP